MTWLLILQVIDLTKINTCEYQKPCTKLFIATSFTLSSCWKQFICQSREEQIDRGIKWILHSSSSNSNKTQTIVTHSNTVTSQKYNEEWKAKHQRYIRHDSMNIMFLKTAQTKLVGHHGSKQEENFWDAGSLSLLSSDNTYPHFAPVHQLCLSDVFIFLDDRLTWIKRPLI